MRECVLILETSMPDGSVALAVDGVLAADVSFAAREASTGARAEALAPAVASALARAQVSVRDLTAIVVSAGPGGFTSLRCAAALAKGMCSALDIPLYAVPSLDLVAWSAALREGTYVAAIAAGRNEWFASAVRVDADGGIVVEPYELFTEAMLAERTAHIGATDIGPERTRDVAPRASAVVPMLRVVLEASPVSLDAWEPDYGRLAEAQVKWEAVHGRSLGV